MAAAGFPAGFFRRLGDIFAADDFPDFFGFFAGDFFDERDFDFPAISVLRAI